MIDEHGCQEKDAQALGVARSHALSRFTKGRPSFVNEFRTKPPRPGSEPLARADYIWVSQIVRQL